MSDDELDPRVYVELEKLNEASEDINRLENKLDELNGLFRSTLSAGAGRLQQLCSRLGGAVARARPYYETLTAARHTHQLCQHAAVQFQRATVLHKNARDTIEMAEARFLSSKNTPAVQFRRAGGVEATQQTAGASFKHQSPSCSSTVAPTENIAPAAPDGEAPQFDGAWQEMLNHATMRLLDAEQLKISSERQHRLRAQAYVECQTKLQRLERSLGRSIQRARVYFEQRQAVQAELTRQKEQLEQVQARLTTAKKRYHQSLHQLESISEDIHLRRQQQQQHRRNSGGAAVAVSAAISDCGSAAAQLLGEIAESSTSDYTEDFRLSQEQQYWSDMRLQLEAISMSPCSESASASVATDKNPELLNEQRSASLSVGCAPGGSDNTPHVVGTDDTRREDE